MNPETGPRQGKVWGETMRGYRDGLVDVHLIHARRGYRCSRHRHRQKWNRFVVLSGKLRIRIWRSHGVDETILGPWQASDVPPGVVHEFAALEDTQAVEIYWVDRLNPDDIVRENVGGEIDD